MSNSYSQHRDWNGINGNNRRGNNNSNHGNSNGYTASQYASRMFPGAWAFGYNWDQNHNAWVIYLKYGNQYYTVYITQDYGYQGNQTGFWY